MADRIETYHVLSDHTDHVKAPHRVFTDGDVQHPLTPCEDTKGRDAAVARPQVVVQLADNWLASRGPPPPLPRVAFIFA